VADVAHGHPTPERAACSGIPERYCRVLALEEHGDWAVALLATNEPDDPYPLQVICRREDGRWLEWTSSNGGGFTTTDEGRLVVTLWDVAPADAGTARVLFEGAEHRVPVKHGYFLFCAWGVALPDDADGWPEAHWWPRVVAFT